MAQPAPCGASWPDVGERLEAEWIPGHWHAGSVCAVDQQGRLTIHYDDGYLQSCVGLDRIRPIPTMPPKSVEGYPLPMLLRAASPRADDKELIECPGAHDSSDGEPLSELSGCSSAASSWDCGACRSSSSRGRSACAGEAPGGKERPHGAGQRILGASVEEGPRQPELRRLSREEVVAMEAADMRRRADRLVREAVESGDWWQLNAAMQLVVSSGVGQDQVAKLQAAMRDQRARDIARQQEQQPQPQQLTPPSSDRRLADILFRGCWCTGASRAGAVTGTKRPVVEITHCPVLHDEVVLECAGAPGQSRLGLPSEAHQITIESPRACSLVACHGCFAADLEGEEGVAL
mmetsp:Transcript_66913/g.193382  ORF Transcript_66913/g.193382 Transcript_66913/m.193382 type:complete len:348 (-) Transcript_66913:159-1202(-)